MQLWIIWALRDREKSNLSIYTNELHENLLKKNGPAFWKCSCNNATRATELNNEYTEIRATYQGLPLIESFDVETISVAMAKLKLGKAPNLDRLTTEHMIYSQSSDPLLRFV